MQNDDAFRAFEIYLTKVFNSKEVGEVTEGADRYSAKKLSKHCKG